MSNGYVTLFQGKRFETYANTAYEARQKAEAHFKPKKKHLHLISVILAEKDGEQVTHSTGAL